MTSLSKEEKYKLWEVARDSHDALKIVNAFYSVPFGVTDSVYDEFWQHKICILAERIVAAEKSIKPSLD